MSVHKMVIGTLLILFGTAFGLYVGVWWAFIGGLVDVINATKSADVPAMAAAVGIAKVIFSIFFGGVSAMVFIAPGIALIEQA